MAVGVELPGRSAGLITPRAGGGASSSSMPKVNLNEAYLQSNPGKKTKPGKVVGSNTEVVPIVAGQEVDMVERVVQGKSGVHAAITITEHGHGKFSKPSGTKAKGVVLKGSKENGNAGLKVRKNVSEQVRSIEASTPESHVGPTRAVISNEGILEASRMDPIMASEGKTARS
ncbi:hypothetical protein V6N11_052376 [Hibiscus sabdariffa]|uniref:Uncharacterized protein n=1 Tax=Hibiscus sabdariffa TaxID=183260 RepID=A0ABR2UAL7_9ROSI